MAVVGPLELGQAVHAPSSPLAHGGPVGIHPDNATNSGEEKVRPESSHHTPDPTLSLYGLTGQTRPT